MPKRTTVVDLADFVAMHNSWKVQGFKRFEVRVPHVCGHSSAVSLMLSSSPDEIDTKHLSQACHSCGIERAEDYRTAVAAAKQRAAGLHLPELSAVSDKQRDYGIYLRDKFIARHTYAVVHHMMDITDASWWIDNRGRLGHARIVKDHLDAKFVNGGHY